METDIVQVSKPLDDDTSASFRMLTKFCQSFLKDKVRNTSSDHFESMCTKYSSFSRICVLRGTLLIMPKSF